MTKEGHMRNRQSITKKVTMLAALLVVAVLPSPLTAAITPVGDISPAYPGGAPDPWTIPSGTEFRVGVTSDGEITVSAGSAISLGDAGYIAWGEETQGIATITGVGSWLSTEGDDPVYIGYAGDGTLNILDGGQVQSKGSVVGALAGSDGHVLVDGEGSTWWMVSEGGSPSLTAAGQGDVSVADGGAIYVGGPGAELAVGDSIAVGASGAGTLVVAGGAQVTSDVGYIGGYDPGYETLAEYFDPNTVLPNGTGQVTVTGSGSTWAVEYLAAGAFGSGTLDVNDEGTVTTDEIWVGVGPDSTGTVHVSDLGSTLSASGGLAVGIWGEGNVVIDQGGMVTADSGYVGGIPFALLEEPYDANYIPDGTGSITVSGSDSALSVTNDLSVGVWGEGTLRVENGAYGGAGGLLIGGENPGFASFADYLDPNNILANGTGHVIVTDAEWESPLIAVGFSGTGTLDVNDGALVTDGDAFVGLLPGAVGTATVDGLDTTWITYSNLGVGVGGQGSLTISNGGSVYANELYIGGVSLTAFEEDYDPNLLLAGTGTVTVTGEGSYLGVTGMTSLYVGYSGTGTLDVNEGGQVETNFGVIGAGPDANGTVTVHDAGSSLTAYEDLIVGAWGQGQLTVSEGGEVTASNFYIGGFVLNEEDFDPNMLADFGPVNGTGTVTVTGADSYLAANGDGILAVGPIGTGTLTISDGGWVDAMTMYVGGVDVNNLAAGPSDWGINDPTGTGTVIVTGAGSTLNVVGADTLFVGYTGPGTMTVSEGGVVQDDYGVLGAASGSVGQATVTGEGSEWNHSADFVVGGWGSGQLAITAGGYVYNEDAYVGGFDVVPLGVVPESLGTPDGTGAVLVSGAGSEWANGSNLFVGYSGTGTLDVNDGGLVTSYDSYIAYAAGSNGTVRVNGTGSLWDVDGILVVGGDWDSTGGTGLLNVSNGGVVSVGDTLILRDTGTLAGDGTIEGNVAVSGTIAPGNSIGTLTVDGDVMFEPNSVYAVEIAGGSSSDKLVATGNVNIVGGTVRPISSGVFVGPHQYEIIEANLVTGEFQVLDTALIQFNFQSAVLDYNDPNSLWLMVYGLRFDDPNLTETRNQAEVGGALQQIAEGGGSEITEAVQGLDDINDIRHAYDQLSGQSRPPLAPLTINSTSQFLGMVTGRVQTLQRGVAGFSDSSLLAMAGPDLGRGGGGMSESSSRGQTFAVGRGSNSLSDRYWGLWARGYGLFGDRESVDAMPGYSYKMYGGSAGLDYQFSDTFLGGLVGGYSQGQADFGGSRDNTDIDAMNFGLYGSLAWEKWYIDAVGAYVGLTYDTERYVDLLSERLTGSFDGYELAGYVETGCNWDLAPDWRLQPLASVQLTYLSMDSYEESGGVSALAFDEQTYTSVKGSLGARLTKTLAQSAGDFRADLQLRGRWVHEFGDNHSTVDAAFVGSPTAVFTVEDKPIARESVLLGAGISADLNKQTRAYVDYDIRLNSDESVQVVSGALQFRW
jgi:T5SS/PEP-CTERM-associated repeat protein